MILRIVADILLIALAAFFPWWIFLAGVFLGIFLFEYYIEAIVVAFLFDVLFGLVSFSLWGVMVPSLPLFTCVAFFLLLLHSSFC